MNDYETLAVFKGVLVAVPRIREEYQEHSASTFITKVKAHSFKTKNDETVNVPNHYLHGQAVCIKTDFNGEITKGAIVTRHFYNFVREDLGKRRVAQVTVKRKTIHDGSTYIILDIEKTSDEKPSMVLGFSEKGSTNPSDIGIPYTDGRGYVCFKPFVSNYTKKMEKKAAKVVAA